MTDDEVFSVLVRWVNAVTGLKVVRAYDSAKHQLPFLMLNLLRSGPVRDHEQSVEYLVTANVDPVSGFFIEEAQPVIETEWVYSLNCYGDGSMDVLRRIIGASRLIQVQEPMMPGLILTNTSARRHLPETINNVWQDRAQIDVFLRGIVQDGYPVDVIDDITPTIVTRI